MKDGIIVFNKPGGMTSHGAVALVRRLCGVKRVGHTGTLDPMALGVLVICVGKATRIIEFIDALNGPDAKAYDCEMRLGVTTDTYDTQGSPVSVQSEESGVVPNEDEVRRVLAAMMGDIRQTPPAYSAIKYKGKKLYELARRGEDLPEEALRPRNIHIESIHVTSVEYDSNFSPYAQGGDAGEGSCSLRKMSGGAEGLGFATVKFSVVCSKGTYIRSICHDAGEALGCGATMSALTRTKSGVFTLADSVTEDDLKEGIFLRRMDEGIPFIPAVKIGEADAKRFINGVRCDGEWTDAGGGAEAYDLIDPGGMESRKEESFDGSVCGSTSGRSAKQDNFFVRVYGESGFLGIGSVESLGDVCVSSAKTRAVPVTHAGKDLCFKPEGENKNTNGATMEIKPYKVIVQ